MESRPKNPEFRNNPENFHPFLVGCFLRMHTSSTPVENLCILCRKNGPAQIILLPIALVSDKGSDEPAYMHSVSSAFRLT